MKSFKEISEQHREEGRFKPVKPHNVASKGLVSPRDAVDSANAKLKEDMDICNHCQHDPCICDDSHGFVTETKRMSAAVKLQRAFEREQAKNKPSPQDAAWEKTKKHLEKPENMAVLKRLKNEGYNDYHNNRTGFAKRQREDDEYHTPDSMRQVHTIKMKLSKDGGEVQHKQMNVTTAQGAEHAKKFAHSKAKEQGWTVHEEVEQQETILEYGDTAKGQKMLAKVQKRAVDRVIKTDDKNRLEPDVSKRDLKTVRKNATTAQRAYDRMDEGRMSDKDAGDLDYHPVAKDTSVPFDGPYTKKPSATAGKHGSGYSTARHLARQAMNKVAKTKLKEEEEFSRKAQIVKNAKKGKKSDDTFQSEPELGSTVVKADN